MHPSTPDDGGESALDFQTLRDRASFTAVAVRRNAAAMFAMALLVVAAAILVPWLIPDRYEVETRLVSQRPDLIASLSNPGRPPSAVALDGSRSPIADLIVRRANLEAMLRETGLLQHWRTHRPWPLRVKDFLVFGRTLTEDELTEALLWTLEKRIQATAQNGVISITATWSDPEMAYRLSNAAYRSFVDGQRTIETAILSESITLLEQRLVDAQRQLDESLAAAKALPGYGKSLAGLTMPQSPRSTDTPEKMRMRLEIAGRQRALEDLLSFRSRRIAELQAQLAEQRAVYSASHPVVANLQKSIEALSVDSPQVEDLRREVARLEGQYVERGGQAGDLAGGPIARPSAGVSTSSLMAALGAPSRDPAEEYARSRLTAAVVRYYNAADNLESARVEREAAKASERFRYLVVRPPLVPPTPKNSALKHVLTLLGLLAAPILGVLAAVLVEMKRGRITQTWQVERGLSLPVIAELPARLR